MSGKPHSLLRLLALCLLALFAGCETNTIPSGAKYVVSVPKAAFYKFGPAQASGPDFVLDEGTRVTMLEHSFGYCRVMTNDGTSGWVSTEDLKPAPPGPYTTSPNTKTNYTLQLNRPMFEQSGRSVEKHSNVNPTPGSPLFDAGDNPLPQNPGQNKVLPGFRY